MNRKLFHVVALSHALMVIAISGAEAGSPSLKPMEKKAMDLISALKSSPYGTRSVCIFGTDVYGIQPGKFMSKAVQGTLYRFPDQGISVPQNEIPYEVSSSGPSKSVVVNGVTFVLSNGNRMGKRADICVNEVKAVRE